MNRAGVMFIKAVFVFCISFLTLPTWAQNCTGKLIGNDICVSKTYTNTIWYSYPNKALVGVDFQRVILQDIDPKKNKISIHVDLLMQWYDSSARIELLNHNISGYFGEDDAEAIWRPNYRING